MRFNFAISLTVIALVLDVVSASTSYDGSCYYTRGAGFVGAEVLANTTANSVELCCALCTAYKGWAISWVKGPNF